MTTYMSNKIKEESPYKQHMFRHWGVKSNHISVGLGEDCRPITKLLLRIKLNPVLNFAGFCGIRVIQLARSFVRRIGVPIQAA